jgi:hypothetical protein
MDLRDLQSAWSKYALQEEGKYRLGEDTILGLLKKKTLSLIERIDRNIRIGLVILLAFIIYFLIDDLLLSPMLLDRFQDIPAWIIPLDVISNLVFVATFLFFVMRYRGIKRSFSPDTHLRNLLTGILDALTLYRRLFYFAVVLLMINMAISFISGFYQGVKIQAAHIHGGIENLSGTKIAMIAGMGVFFLAIFIVLSSLFLRWGFNKLYGNYLRQTRETLGELDETE